MSEHISINVIKFSNSSLAPTTSNRSSTAVVSMVFLLHAMRASDSSEGNMVEADEKRVCIGITLANSSSSSLVSLTQLFNKR